MENETFKISMRVIWSNGIYEEIKIKNVISYKVCWKGKGVYSITCKDGKVFYYPFKVVDEFVVTPVKD